ncbi:alpha/beta hydrolase family protein [Piscinibacter koreensis]|uniref:Alpha/beta fold hydrolase n=1 Tax=Piscinibacter koreensis TaxID=2742824 RepID=A0A7Y6NNW6_9BURK|nr:alpha/beta fold hydrolase [Schlegelella koreensis]NUZ06630.1 alpha/beta fold hydrolase [Schlegelella koreensis]
MTTRDEKIEIQGACDKLAGTLITPGMLVPGVLFVHGWGGSQQQYLVRARKVAGLGCVCLTFDLGGHAATKEQREQVSRETNLRDLTAAYDRLVEHPSVDPSAIAVVGSSYGGYLAAFLTTIRPVRWLALRVPALYIDDGWEVPKLQLHKDQDLRAYRRNFVAAGRNGALRACAEFKGDVLLVASEHDDIIPPAVIESYREACVQAKSLTYRNMTGADHGLTQEVHQRAYSALLLQWLAEMFASARRDPDTGPEPAIAAAEAATGAGEAVHEPEAPPMAS